MLLESAFFALPEFLHGTPYERYDYEATVVMALGMALLQELNGRNVNNPVSALRGEVRYQAGYASRADMHLSLASLGLFTDELRAFGYKDHNWLEAKYLQLNDQGAPKLASSAATSSLAADLFRLALYPPEGQANAGASHASRYFLHVYQASPESMLSFERNVGGGRIRRDWLDALTNPGREEVSLQVSGESRLTNFKGSCGGPFPVMNLTLTITTFEVKPLTGGVATHFYLSRIDKVVCDVQGLGFTVDGPALTETHPGAFDAVRLGALMSAKK